MEMYFEMKKLDAISKTLDYGNETAFYALLNSLRKHPNFFVFLIIVIIQWIKMGSIMDS